MEKYQKSLAGFTRKADLTYSKCMWKIYKLEVYRSFIHRESHFCDLSAGDNKTIESSFCDLSPELFADDNKKLLKKRPVTGSLNW